MKISRRLVAAAAIAAAGLAIVAPAAPASAAPTGPVPVDGRLTPVKAGTPTWVQMWWTTDVRACDVKVVAWKNSLATFSYPGGRGYTTLSKDSTLDRGESDFAKIRVDAALGQGNFALVPVQVFYSDCGAKAEAHDKSVGFLLPVHP
jgi:hypothetical protein